MMSNGIRYPNKKFDKILCIDIVALETFSHGNHFGVRCRQCGCTLSLLSPSKCLTSAVRPNKLQNSGVLPDVLATARTGKGSPAAPWCAAAARQALNQRWKAQAAFAALRAHACSLLELPIAGPSDPSDDQEVPLGELLAGSLRTGPSRLV
ncbi:unnamed protein product [Symbiodinium microadriaticum]|nr:unnamed protein product [Symbiodinium microadriaticum]